MEELNFETKGKVCKTLAEKGDLLPKKQLEEFSKIKSKVNLADEENLQAFEEECEENPSLKAKSKEIRQLNTKANAEKTQNTKEKTPVQNNSDENGKFAQGEFYTTPNIENDFALYTMETNNQKESQEFHSLSVAKKENLSTQDNETKSTNAFFASNAFNVSNREQAENIDKEQEYQVAETNLTSSPLKLIVNLSASAVNFISNSITGKSEPSAFEKRYENEREVINPEIQEKFNNDKEDLEKNKTLANCATTIVLKQVYNEVISDSEYANALLDLGNSIIKADDEGKYDSALNKFLEKNGYHTNAFGNIVDENNKEIETSEIVEELEDFVQEIYLEYEPKDEECDEIISETIALIQGDDSKLTSLSENIDKYSQKITKEEENINLKEEMLAELTAQKSELVASRASCGVIDDLGELFFMGNKAEENYYNERRELLEKAIVSDKYEDMVLAYQKIYFDKDVCINSEGKVCSFDTADENCTTEKIMNMETGDIDEYIELEIEESKEARQLLELIENGNMSLDGEIISVEYIADILIAQTRELMQDANNAVYQQGIISKWIISTGNSFFGIGTSEPEMKAQIQQYTAQVNELKNCKDPERFAALYKSLTGEDFSVESMATLLAYDSMKNPKEDNSNKTANNKENVVALDEFIDDLTDQVNEAGNGNTDLLLVVGNTRAAEGIEDYISTQHTIKEAIIGVATGIAATLAVSFAPVTGGLSLLVGAGVGAAVNSSLQFVDSIYDSDNDGDYEINYSLEEAGKDAILGAVNGSVGVISNAAGGAVARTIAGQAGKVAVATTFKESARNVLISIGSKTAGAAVEGFIDGSISAGAEYSLSALMGEKEFSTEELLEVAMMGGAAGSIFNVGINFASEGIRGIQTGLIGLEVNNILREGRWSKNDIANIIAASASIKAFDNGKINKYAIGSLMENAENALTALRKAGLSKEMAIETAMKLDTYTQSQMQTIINTVMENKNLFNLSDKPTPEELANILSTSSNTIADKHGRAVSFRIDGKDDTCIDFLLNISTGKIEAYEIIKERSTEEVLEIKNKLSTLQYAGWVNRYCLFDLSEKDYQELSQYLVDDINLMYKAYMENINPEDLFVKSYSSISEAANAISIGDVCRIGTSDKISIKLSDGTIKELNLSAQKYMELFPPVSRYTIQQHSSGDCYIISLLDAMTKKPETRAIILECFTENADGSISVKLPKGDFTLTVAPGEKISDFVSKKIMDMYSGKIENSQPESLLSSGSYGLQMIEYLCGLELLSKDKRFDLSTIDLDNVTKDITAQSINDSSLEELFMYADSIRGSGNYSGIVFEMFGIDAKNYTEIELRSNGSSEPLLKNQKFTDFINNPDSWDDYIITIGSKQTIKDNFPVNEYYDIRDNHMYTITPFVSNTGEVMFKITNPWNGFRSKIISADLINEYFDYMCITKVK